MAIRQQRWHANRNAANNGRAGKSEIYIYTDEDGQEQWLAVEPLRQWAENNLPLVGTNLDMKKVEDIISKGKIDESHFKKITLNSFPRPMLVCENFVDNLSEIVDGNHSYVAFAVTVHQAQKMGLSVQNLAMPAYVVERKDWTRFLIPKEERATNPN